MIYEKFRLSASLLAAIALIAQLSGCGGGNDASPANTPVLTKVQYIKQANKICQAGLRKKDQEVRAAAEREGQKILVNPNDMRALIEEVLIPTYGETITQLKHLNPPNNDEAAVAKMIGAYDTALDETKSDPLAAFQRNPFAEANNAAAGFGLNACTF